MDEDLYLSIIHVSQHAYNLYNSCVKTCVSGNTSCPHSSSLLPLHLTHVFFFFPPPTSKFKSKILPTVYHNGSLHTVHPEVLKSYIVRGGSNVSVNIIDLLLSPRPNLFVAQIYYMYVFIYIFFLV